MNYSMESVREITHAQNSMLVDPEQRVTIVGFDSRRISNPSQTLFFALDGNHRSGQDFIEDAYQKGVRNFVIKNNTDVSKLASCNFIFCDNVLESLVKLATFHRSNFTGPVIGITGSNGKTIVKECLHDLLKNDFRITRSPRSYNSTLGVAISILGIEPYHQLAIIEAGISRPGDMDVLEKMIKPSLGVLTHLGTAHDENFPDRTGKAEEKMKLFANCDVLVLPSDIPEAENFKRILLSGNPLMKIITWGQRAGSTLRVADVKADHGYSLIYVNYRSSEHQVKIPFSDRASVENAMSCLGVLMALERWDPDHITQFSKLHSLENRLVFSEGIRGNYLVNDSYSNDPDSLEVALDFLMRQQPGKPQTVILSDMQQADTDKERLYRKVAGILEDKKTKKLIGVGKDLIKYRDLFSGDHKLFFENTEDLLNSDLPDSLSNEAILIKGARSFRLERVYEVLREKAHKTVLEIDLHALRNNFNYFRSILKPGVKIMAMVKAFGYGSGSFEASRSLEYSGVDYLAVAYIDEGVALRNSGVNVPVMIMNAEPGDLDILLKYRLEPVVFSPQNLEFYKKAGVEINIHVEVDTGMHRLGFQPKDIGRHFTDLSGKVKIMSVFSHLASSEEPANDEFTKNQIQKFLSACNEVGKSSKQTFLRHIANTGGILRFPEAHLEMVRLGIGLYGISPDSRENSGLQNVLTLRTVISQIKSIPAGESVGYGLKGVSDHDRRIAVLPVGYADGLWRSLGNENGYALIHGMPAKYIGSICMDMAMVDITDIDCREGDSVEIFGQHLRVEKLAEWCNTIPYEILTSVSGRVRREYTGEN